MKNGSDHLEHKTDIQHKSDDTNIKYEAMIENNLQEKNVVAQEPVWFYLIEQELQKFKKKSH